MWRPSYLLRLFVAINRYILNNYKIYNTHILDGRQQSVYVEFCKIKIKKPPHRLTRADGVGWQRDQPEILEMILWIQFSFFSVFFFVSLSASLRFRPQFLQKSSCGQISFLHQLHCGIGSIFAPHRKQKPPSKIEVEQPFDLEQIDDISAFLSFLNYSILCLKMQGIFCFRFFPSLPNLPNPPYIKEGTRQLVLELIENNK